MATMPPGFWIVVMLVVLALVGTIPAFYAELLQAAAPLAAALAYLLAAAVTAASRSSAEWTNVVTSSARAFCAARR
jgi:hypothetical protein